MPLSHRSRILSFAVASLLAAGAIAPAQPAVPKGFDFENLSPWDGLKPDTRIVHEGGSAGLWEDTVAVDRILNRSFPSDLSGAEALRFWAHSERANDSRFAVVLVSENDATDGADYYYQTIAVDWEGWKEIVLPFSAMKIRRQPIGFHRITQFKFASTDYDCGKTATPGTVLRFDEMTFVPQGARVSTVAATRTVQPLPYFDFEGAFTGWHGLVPDDSNAWGGMRSAAWPNTEQVTRINCTALPKNLTAFEGIELALFSASANGAKIGFVLLSENPATDQSDYYSYVLPITWTGWQKVRIPFDWFKSTRSPKGLDQIDELRIVSQGYATGGPVAGTSLKIDDFALFGSGGTTGASSGAGEARRAADGGPLFHETLKGTIAAARANKRLVFVFAGSEDVTASANAERDLLRHSGVASVLEGFESFRLDIRKDHSDAKYFQVATVPTLLVYTPSGKELLRLRKLPAANDLRATLSAIKENNPVP